MPNRPDRILPILKAFVILYILVAIHFTANQPQPQASLPTIFTNHYYDECLSQQLSDNCTIWRVPSLVELRWYLTKGE